MKLLSRNRTTNLLLSRSISAEMRSYSSGHMAIITRSISLILISTILITFMPSIGHGATSDKIIGNWKGTLKVAGVELRLVFKIKRGDDGKLVATLDSIDQGAKDIAATGMKFEDPELVISFMNLAGMYKGKISTDGKTIIGTWTQAGNTHQLNLEKVEGEITLGRRPQDPVKPYPYLEEEVAYSNEKAGITLAGTLTMPKTGGPFTAALLITGSGAQNRDEEIMNHRPFLVLSDYLTRQGLAVLRVDDRGVGGSTGSFATATSEDFSWDVQAGIEYLKTRKEINSERIGLIGHSEGGLIAPMVAARSDDVAFIILMAGPGITGEEILYLQSALIMKANGASERMIELNRKLQTIMFDVVKQDLKQPEAGQKLKKSIDDYINGLNEADKALVKSLNVQSQIQGILTPWFKFFLSYDPAPTLTKVKCPVLAINGMLDLQVPWKENLGVIEIALRKGKNKNFFVSRFKGLNHLFQTAETGALFEYSKIEETISPEVLHFIGDWIARLYTSE